MFLYVAIAHQHWCEDLYRVFAQMQWKYETKDSFREEYMIELDKRTSHGTYSLTTQISPL